MCIKDNAIAKHIYLIEAQVNAIADELTYFPPESPVFSLHGCRPVDKKVDIYRPPYRRNEL